MSRFDTLKLDDLIPGLLTTRTAQQVAAMLDPGSSQNSPAQTAAAAGMWNLTPARRSGTVRSLSLSLNAIPGTGETYVIDVKRNGTTILTGPFTVNKASFGTAPLRPIDLPLANPTTIHMGDYVTVDRTYTAGGSPAITSDTVVLLWA